ncbi:HNH endonuclease, partial [Candidatus Roizmanbacteria bacterium]|nr:HNH endonuclease [Candidatus Roizmanbacteria bacterium]
QQNIDYLKIIKLLESYAFKIFQVSNGQANTGDTVLYKLAFKVLYSKITPEDACSEINSKIIQYYRFQEFKNQMQALFEKKQGFYHWDGLRYYLFEYDEKLRTDNRIFASNTRLNWADLAEKDFRQRKTIEHIYPQSATKNYIDYCSDTDSRKKKVGYEKLQKDWAAFSSYSEEERVRLCHSLGNLLPISNSDNASFSNDKFLCKVDQSNKGDQYKNRGYRFDSMSAQIVAKEIDWTPESIKNRGLLMLNYFLELLGENLAIMNENEKINLLGLGFLIENDLSGTKQ